MANEEQLSILRQGVDAWNKWREENPQISIINLVEADLSELDLSQIDLSEAYLMDADLYETELIKANLSEANFERANLLEANLRGADLSYANMSYSKLQSADLRGANLSGANLTEANLSGANLTGANMRWAGLEYAILSETILENSTFWEAGLRNTIFVNTDLSKVLELKYAIHSGPSSIGIDTITTSKGKIPESFLRGCGLSDLQIEMVKLYNPELRNEERNEVLYKIYDLQASQAIQISPLFISYSHGNTKFVDKLGELLTQRGIRYWRDIHDMKAGRMEKQIDRAIRKNPTVLLVLSKNSQQSDWVEHEVRIARELERDMGRDVLCPVALDDSWKSSRWPKRVIEQIMEYNILDFSEWEDDVKFEGMFRKLIDGLQLFYKG